MSTRCASSVAINGMKQPPSTNAKFIRLIEMLMYVAQSSRSGNKQLCPIRSPKHQNCSRKEPERGFRDAPINTSDEYQKQEQRAGEQAPETDCSFEIKVKHAHLACRSRSSAGRGSTFSAIYPCFNDQLEIPLVVFSYRKRDFIRHYRVGSTTAWQRTRPTGMIRGLNLELLRQGY